jgi:hypothetical protein
MSLISKIINDVINPLIVVLVTVAIAVFFWGIIGFIWNSGSEEKRTTGKQHIIWGLVGLFIMLTAAGIIQIIQKFVQF